MKENDLTKLTRWIIPGWVAMLSFYFFVLVDKVFAPSDSIPIMDSVSNLISSTSNYTALIITFLVAASGIPIGFIIYQGYFFLRWNSPFSRDGLIPPLLSGRMNDLKVILADIDVNKTLSESEWRKLWISKDQYLKDHGFQWRYIELLFTQAAQEIESDVTEKISYARYRYLHEITHTLGASIGSFYVGFLCYFALKFLRQDIYLIANICAIMGIIYVLFYLLNREESSTTDCNKHLDSKKPLSLNPVFFFSIVKNRFSFAIIQPGSLLIIVLILFHLFNNPLIYPDTSPLFTFSRVILSALICVIWIQAKDSYSRAFMYGDLLVFTSAIILSIIFRYYLSSVLLIDWALFTNLSSFLFVNLILFKNRQNTVNDLLALQNYTLHRLIEKGGFKNGEGKNKEIGIIIK